jgi:hypothetical protein
VHLFCWTDSSAHTRPHPTTAPSVPDPSDPLRSPAASQRGDQAAVRPHRPLPSSAIILACTAAGLCAPPWLHHPARNGVWFLSRMSPIGMVPSACRASSSSQGGGLFEADPAQATGRRIAATTSKEEARAGEDAAPPSSVCGPLPFLAMVEAAAAPHWPAEAVLPSISQPTSSAWLLRGTRSRSSSRGMAAASRCRRPRPSNRCSLLPQNPKARRSSWGGRDRLQILGHKNTITSKRLRRTPQGRCQPRR